MNGNKVVSLLNLLVAGFCLGVYFYTGSLWNLALFIVNILFGIDFLTRKEY